jgi:hypothetical protein
MKINQKDVVVITDEPAGNDRLDNLCEPASGLFGAHGRFNRMAKEKSEIGWMGRHQAKSALVALVAGIFAVGYFMR